MIIPVEPLYFDINFLEHEPSDSDSFDEEDLKLYSSSLPIITIPAEENVTKSRELEHFVLFDEKLRITSKINLKRSSSCPNLTI